MKQKRLLVLNVHFAPFSFGGATVVAEEMAIRLERDYGWETLVFTLISDRSLPRYHMVRYRAKGLNIIALNVTDRLAYQQDYSNPQIDEFLENVIDLFQPSVCHVHAVQRIGIGALKRLPQLGCRLVITAHDCWWLCDRQFMIDSSGHYCHQWTIDHEQCRYCTSDFDSFKARDEQLRGVLRSADLLLFPSRFQQLLYEANGFSASNTKVNKNGIRLPDETLYMQLRERRRVSNRQVVFGFTGGPGPIKGADLIVQACRALGRNDYSLRIVDAANNVGSTWRRRGYWSIPGKLQVLPAYSQQTMDEFFHGIDVLLFPSQWKESFGLTIREALARDVWVIATDAGAVSEDVHSGINGQLIPFDGNYVALKSAMEACFQKDWSTYTNSRRDDLRTLDQQAEELDGYLETQLH